MDLVAEYPGQALALPGSILSLPEPGHLPAGFSVIMSALKGHVA